jgi:glycosyltransferase involved in cell wall biosynthesis
LLFSAVFFSAVFVVNHQLELWVKKNLFFKKVFYIPNFATSDEKQYKATTLNGCEGKRIVCLANLKKPKNHIALLIAFEEMKLQDLGWSLHLIGKDYKDSYSSDLKVFVAENNLQKAIFIYDSQNDIKYILSQATIGILCSTDEGFPVSLLEYGLAQLAVVCTNVGYCPEVVKDNYSGLLFDPLNNLQLQEQLRKMILDKTKRDSFRLHLHELVLEKYSREKGVQLLLSQYRAL